LVGPSSCTLPAALLFLSLQWPSASAVARRLQIDLAVANSISSATNFLSFAAFFLFDYAFVVLFGALYCFCFWWAVRLSFILFLSF
jgi:hypothetical protein